MPSIYYCAYSEPINPQGATPVLTRDQIWRGLQRKIRRAQDFVAPIEACEIIEEKENEVTRVAHFKAMFGKPAMQVKEVCKSYYPTKVDFWQTSGAVITNTISDGPEMGDEDLVMTYTFEWRLEAEEDSEEYRTRAQEYREGAKNAVHSSIEAMRKLAAAGELDG